MQLSGKLKLNPIAYKKGRRRTSSLRKHHVRMAASLEAAISNSEVTNKNLRRRIVIAIAKYREGTCLSHAVMTELWECLCALNNVFHQTHVAHPYISKLVVDIKHDLRLHPDRAGWLIFPVDPSIVEPFREEIARTAGVKPALPNWLPHVSVIRGTTKHRQGEQFSNNPTILAACLSRSYNIQVDATIEQAAYYYYLRVTSPELEQCRRELGLSPKPHPDFHLTIGSGPRNRS